LVYTDKLTALATLAATGAFAQSSVQIYGLADVGFQSNNYKGTAVSGINGNGSTTSQINVKATEDLGGGMKANLFVENDWALTQTQANTGVASSIANATNSAGASWLNSEIKLGLSGGFGTIDAGVVNNKSLTAAVSAQPLGTAIGSGFGSILKASAGTGANTSTVVRFDNSVRYESPAFSGFSVSGYYAAKQTKSNNANVFSTTLGAYDRAGVQELALSYNNGPISAIATTQAVDYKDVIVPGAASYLTGVPVGAAATAGSVKSTINSFAGNYAMGDLTLYAGYQTVKDDKSVSAVDTKAYVLGAKYVVGANTFSATSGELTNDVTAKKSKFYGLGYDYALSKTTALYARYESLKDDGGTVAAVTGFTETNTTRTRSALGLRVAF